jgi:hypothetical protein
MGAKHNFKNSSATYIVAVIRVFEICRTEADRLSAGPIEASYLVVLLSAKPFVVVWLYAIFFKGIPLIPPINDNITKRLRITLFTGFAIYETWTNTTVIQGLKMFIFSTTVFFAERRYR